MHMQGFSGHNKFTDKYGARIINIVIVFLVLFRVWLLCGSNWFIEIESYFDSHLEINSAISIVSGNWMGDYDKYILCKNPSYPLFLALCYVLHIPYPVGLGLLMVGTSLLFANAITPISGSKLARVIVFIFVLYNPVGFGGQSVYPYRNALVPWAVLGMTACIIAIFLRKEEAIGKITPWGLGGMIFSRFFWLLREDSVWILPFMISAAVITILFIIIKKYSLIKMLLYSFVTVLPIFGIILSVLLVSEINYKKYGIFATNDRTTTSEAKVLGLLISIDDGSDLNEDVWVSSEAVELAKENSETFAALYLPPFDEWPRKGDYSIWALRDCLAGSGYYTDGYETDQAYKQIERELQNAFDEGRLQKKKGIKLSDTSGIYSVDEVLGIFPIAFKGMFNHIIYSSNRVDFEQVLHATKESDLLKFEKILGIALIRSEEELAREDADSMMVIQNNNLRNSLNRNAKISNAIIIIYKYTGLVVFILAVFGFIATLLKIFMGNTEKYDVEIVIIMAGILLTAYLNNCLVALWGTGFGLSADDYLFNAYTTVQYLLIAVFEVLGFRKIRK